MEYKRKFLTEQAAVEDAKTIYQKALNFLAEYIFIFPHLDPGEETNIIEKVEQCLGLGDNYKKAIEKELLSLYAYAQADAGKIKLDFDEYSFHSAIDVTLSKIAGIFFMSAANVDLRKNPVEVASMETLDRVCPRTAYALHVAFARRELHQAINATPKDTVSTVSIALLADISYTYIIKVIKQGILPAIKKDRQWHIPAVDALRFVLKYFPSEQG